MKPLIANLSNAERKLLIRALEMVSRETFERLDTLVKHGALPASKTQEYIQNCNTEIALIDGLYDEVRKGRLIDA